MPEKTKKILVADDEMSMAKALSIKLSREGFDVKSVHNGEDAFALAEKEKFDLILLDLVMPKLDGFGFLEKMKKNGSKTKVIILSNLSQEEDAIRAKGLGAVDFFVKSNTPIADIVEKVKNILG